MIFLNTSNFVKSTLNTAIITAATALAFSPLNASAQANIAANTINADTSTAIKELDIITVVGESMSSLPTHIPTVFEGVTGEQITQTINATDSADALKYLPSLNVRKRYIGDYNHAVLASRASGTGNSARSLVYADGILLSNLLGNGASYTPRWGLVTR
jgi:iron complex outermembrane receptor protein